MVLHAAGGLSTSLASHSGRLRGAVHHCHHLVGRMDGLPGRELRQQEARRLFSVPGPPRRATVPLELAISGAGPDEAILRDRGWRVCEALTVAGTPVASLPSFNTRVRACSSPTRRVCSA